MAFDLGEVLARAWQITWKYKVLWVYGLISMLFGFLFLPIGFAPMISIFMTEDVPVWFEEPLYILGYMLLFVVWMVVFYLVGALLQAALSLGVLQADRGAGGLVFWEMLKASRPYFRRFMGVLTLLAGGVVLVMAGYFTLQIVVSILTLGLGAMCLVPLQFLLYPLMLVAYAWMELALASIVVDELGVFEAARRGWQLFRQNLLPVSLMTLIMYLGVGMLSGFIAIPLMVPFFAVPFAWIEGAELSKALLWVTGLCALAYLPVLAVFQAAAMTFMKSGWVLTYLRLTRDHASTIPAAAPA